MDSSQRSIEQPVDLTERITRTENYYTDCGGFGDVWRCMLQTGETQKIVVRTPYQRSSHPQIFLGCSQSYQAASKLGVQ